MKRIGLICISAVLISIMIIITSASCTLIQVTDAGGAKGGAQRIETSSGCLHPLSGPSISASAKICRGRPVSQITIKESTGQFLWNLFLGPITAYYTVEVICVGKDSKQAKKDSKKESGP